MSASDNQAIQSLPQLLEVQQNAFRAEGPVSAATRKDRLQRVIDMLVKHCDPFCAAMEADFGGRSPVFSMMNDVAGSLGSLKHARDHLETWMQDQTRPSVQPFDAFGATAWVKYQPKGVVGIIGTWNAPLFTLLSPLASVFAAGNRAILKPSEIAPSTAELLQQAVAEFFKADELTVVQGGPTVAAEFSKQAWNHLVFTGATSVGKLIMKAASDNLVPVTLELGGKSPVIIGTGANIANAAERIAVGKGANSGQLCVSPDVVWVKDTELESLLTEIQSVYQGLFPTTADNIDVTPIVNDRHFDRVSSYVNDADAKGARIVVAGDDHAGHRRLPLRMVVNPSADSDIAKYEIFGPALVIRTYTTLKQAVAEINAGERRINEATNSRRGCKDHIHLPTNNIS